VSGCSTCEVSKLCRDKPYIRHRIYPNTERVDILFVGASVNAQEALCRTVHLDSTLIEIIDDAFPKETSFVFTNLIACVPYTDTDLDSIRPPSRQEIKNCRKYLDQIITVCNPKHIVTLGKLADSSLKNVTHTAITDPFLIGISSHTNYEFAKAIVTLKGLSL